tara:strand:- start:6326 stop:6556 length:231 start_codon:yes stop_codon:yes gene_type:complete
MSKLENHKWTEITEQNAKDIVEIKHSISAIKDNHLRHLETDMCKQSKAIEKIDTRIWAVLIILVVSTVIGMVKSGL